MTYLLLARRYWKALAFGLLLMALAVQSVRLGAANNRAEKLQFHLNECREGRKQDRQEYEDAQRKAAEQNKAEVKRIVSEQDRISSNVEADLSARLERLRRELRDKAAGGSPNRPGAPSDGKPAPNAPDPSKVCISTEQFLLGAEYEEKLEQWINWYEQLLEVKR